VVDGAHGPLRRPVSGLLEGPGPGGIARRTGLSLLLETAAPAASAAFWQASFGLWTDRVTFVGGPRDLKSCPEIQQVALDRAGSTCGGEMIRPVVGHCGLVEDEVEGRGDRAGLRDARRTGAEAWPRNRRSARDRPSALGLDHDR
jgi:hypothetical protein